MFMFDPIMIFIHFSSLRRYYNAGQLHSVIHIKAVDAVVILSVRLQRDILEIREIGSVLKFVKHHRAESFVLIIRMDAERKNLDIVFVANGFLGHIHCSEHLLDQRRSA